MHLLKDPACSLSGQLPLLVNEPLFWFVPFPREAKGRGRRVTSLMIPQTVRRLWLLPATRRLWGPFTGHGTAALHGAHLPADAGLHAQRLAAHIWQQL